MKGLRRHPFRVLGRLLWFVGEVIIALFDFLIRCAFRPKKSALAARALWLQRASRRHLRIFKFEAQVAGPVPSGGLLVSNHLSYLDIPVMASLTPAVFVAKHEIKSWPVIGWLARLAGTLVIDRDRRMGGRAGECRRPNRARWRRAGGGVSRRNEFGRPDRLAVQVIVARAGHAANSFPFHQLDSV